MSVPIFIVASSSVPAAYCYPQTEIKEAVRSIIGDHHLLSVFDRAGIESRHFAFPLDYYLQERGFKERNDDYIREASKLGIEALRRAIEEARISPTDIDALVFVTTTGLATPSLDSVMARECGLRNDVVRMPFFGIGCAGGAYAVARAHDFAAARPGAIVAAVSIEICSLSFRPHDPSPTHIVGSALFADGAAAVIMRGHSATLQHCNSTSDWGHFANLQHSNSNAVANWQSDPMPDYVAKLQSDTMILAVKSWLYADEAKIMGWDFDEHGMKLVLSRDLIAFLGRNLLAPLRDFLAENSLSIEQIDRFILHPGGGRVIDAYSELLGISDEKLFWSKDSLRRNGNVSSASVLLILDDMMRSNDSIRPVHGEKGLLMAVGPGFAVEMVLLEWS